MAHYQNNVEYINITMISHFAYQTSDLVVKMKYMRDSRDIHLAGSGRGFVV